MAAQLGLAGSWKAIKPHLPLIKFRKGSLEKFMQGSAPATDIDQSSESPHVEVSKKYKALTTHTLEDWQVPASYKRLSFTEEEIEYINRGGPA